MAYTWLIIEFLGVIPDIDYLFPRVKPYSTPTPFLIF